VEQKEYFHHTGYPGGGRTESFEHMLKRKPSLVVEHAVKGMLPKSKLGRKIIKKLKVYAGNEHPHTAQQPKEFNLPY
jgi:large subunit ribosomal protein L13